MHRSQLRRWHIWLGWIAAIPILLWVVSGLIMVVRPIEEVSGRRSVERAGADPAGRAAGSALVAGVPYIASSLEQRAAGPRWVVKIPDGKTRLADPCDGPVAPAAIGQ